MGERVALGQQVIPFAVLDGIDTSGAGFTGLKKQAIAQQGRGHNGKLLLQFTERLFGNGNSYADTGYIGSERASSSGLDTRCRLPWQPMLAKLTLPTRVRILLFTPQLRRCPLHQRRLRG